MAKYNLPAGASSRDWTVKQEWKSPAGFLVTRGTELSITGERGRFRFYEHVVTDKDAEWLTVIGGPGRGDHQTRQFRFFRPERVKTVHRKPSSMTGVEAKKVVLEKKRAKRVGL